MKKFPRIVGTIAFAVTLVTQSASYDLHAGELPGSTRYGPDTQSGLTFTVTPFYLWIPGLQGTVGVLGFSANVDATPVDLLNNIGEVLDVVDDIYLGMGEVRYGRFGAFYDVMNFEVSSLDEIDIAFVNGALDVAFQQTTTTLAGSYRLVQTDDAHFDVLAGARIWDIDVNVGLDLNIIALSARDGDKWVDPLIGGKGRIDLTENLYLSGWAMIGGFGVGSDFMWDVWGTAGYEISGWLDAYAGFRAMGTRYESGSFEWDIVQYGPTIGAALKF